MKLLITSGGTRVAIDPVRYLANVSTGKFGSELAKHALLKGAEVIYLISSDGKTPFSRNIDLRVDHAHFDETIGELKELYQLYGQYHHHYHEFRYVDFYDYEKQLKQIIINQKPDIIILAAAVSDYLVSNYSEHKIRSHNLLNIQLTHAPKLIRSIKTWHPDCYLVGFKLLVNVKESELIEAAKINIAEHQVDLVVANDLMSIVRGKHEILLIDKNNKIEKCDDQPANKIIARLLD